MRICIKKILQIVLRLLIFSYFWGVQFIIQYQGRFLHEIEIVMSLFLKSNKEISVMQLLTVEVEIQTMEIMHLSGLHQGGYMNSTQHLVVGARLL